MLGRWLEMAQGHPYDTLGAIAFGRFDSHPTLQKVHLTILAGPLDKIAARPHLGCGPLGGAKKVPALGDKLRSRTVAHFEGVKARK